MRRSRVFRIGLVLTGMAVPALAAEAGRDRLPPQKAALQAPCAHQTDGTGPVPPGRPRR